MLEHLNWFDFVIMAIIVLSITISFFRGFLKESISLITWVMAVVVALKFASRVTDLMQSLIHSEILRYLVAFLALFTLVFILGVIINLIVHRLIDVVGLTIVDRVLGIVFGSARGLIAVAVILMFLSVTPMEDTKWLATSQLAPEFTSMVTWLDGFMPEQLQQVSQWVIGGNQENSTMIIDSMKSAVKQQKE